MSATTLDLEAFRRHLLRQVLGNHLAKPDNYPLEGNQYKNNLPGIFSGICPGASTCTAWIRMEINSPHAQVLSTPKNVY